MSTHNERVTIYLDTHANSSTRFFDYDEAFAVFSRSEDEKFDLFVRIAYEISVRDYSLEKIERFKSLLSSLAVSVLEFNLNEAA